MAVQRLRKIRIPTLVIDGARDTHPLLTGSDTLAEGIPNACKIVLPTLMRLANTEAPQQYNDQVPDLFAEVALRPHAPSASDVPTQRIVTG